MLVLHSLVSILYFRWQRSTWFEWDQGQGCSQGCGWKSNQAPTAPHRVRTRVFCRSAGSGCRRYPHTLPPRRSGVRRFVDDTWPKDAYVHTHVHHVLQAGAAPARPAPLAAVRPARGGLRVPPLRTTPHQPDPRGGSCVPPSSLSRRLSSRVWFFFFFFWRAGRAAWQGGFQPVPLKESAFPGTAPAPAARPAPPAAPLSRHPPLPRTRCGAAGAL